MATTFAPKQPALFEEANLGEDGEHDRPTPAEIWDADVTRHAFDELVHLARQYRSSESYQQLMDFVARFTFYSPYNALPLPIQGSPGTGIEGHGRDQGSTEPPA